MLPRTLSGINWFLPVLLLCFSTHASASLQGDTGKVEVWQGSMEVQPGSKITMQIRMRQEDGNWKAELQSINPAGPAMPINEFAVDGETIRLKVKVGEVTAEFTGTKSGDEAKGTWKQAGRELPLTLKRMAAEVLIEAWNGTLVAGGGQLELQFRVLEVGGKRVSRFDSLNQNALGFVAEVVISGNRVSFKVPLLKAAFEGELDETGDKAKGVWKQNGNELPMEFIRSINAAAMPKPPPPPKRPQTPHPPFRYESTEVKFENVADGVTLAGTLTYPRKQGQKFPAVILISGSGPQDRDETLFYHKPFLLIADQLTRAGIAVLRFDDRGVGESTGDFTAATSEDFANDVRAAVAFLQQHEAIDASKIGLLGHSEGGLIAPMVAASDPNEIAFLVLLAGPGVNGYEILRDQGRRIAEAEGIPADAIAEESALRDAVALAVRNAPEILDGEQVVESAINQFVEQYPESEREQIRPLPEQVAAFKQLAMPWFRFFLKYEPAGALQGVRCPVLAINGERDLQVWHETNLKAIAAALRAGGNKNYRVVRLPGLNHLFQRAKTGAVSEYNEITQTIAPEALDLVEGWIRKQVQQ